MTKEELAAKINGREYTQEMTKNEEHEAKESGLVVIFGASDDLCELRGAIDDEAGCYDGGDVYFTHDGKVLEDIDDDDDEVLKKYGVLQAVSDQRKAAIAIHAGWCESDGYSWFMSTTGPHATFDVMEGTEKYCRGLVIDLKELKDGK